MMTNEQIEALKADIASIDTLSIEECKTLREKYQDVIADAKKAKEKASKSKSSKEKQKTYKYPFVMYFGHQYRDVTSLFEEGKEYTEEEISKILTKAGYKEFRYANEVKYEYFANENCLYPKLKVGNRG